MTVTRVIIIGNCVGAAHLIALLEATSGDVVTALGPDLADLRQKTRHEIDQHRLHVALQRIVPAECEPAPTIMRHAGKQKAQWKRERSARR